MENSFRLAAIARFQKLNWWVHSLNDFKKKLYKGQTRITAFGKHFMPIWNARSHNYDEGLSNSR